MGERGGSLSCAKKAGSPLPCFCCLVATQPPLWGAVLWVSHGDPRLLCGSGSPRG